MSSSYRDDRERCYWQYAAGGRCPRKRGSHYLGEGDPFGHGPQGEKDTPYCDLHHEIAKRRLKQGKPAFLNVRLGS